MKEYIDKYGPKKESPVNKKILIFVAILFIALVAGFIANYNTPIEMVLQDLESFEGNVDYSEIFLGLAGVIFSGIIFFINYLN
jgi:hypothetical protein